MDARKLYRTILKLYPARFREEYGKPLEQQFSDEYSEAEGNRARFGLWLPAIMSTVALGVGLMARRIASFG